MFKMSINSDGTKMNQTLRDPLPGGLHRNEKPIKEPQPKYPFARYRTSVLLGWLEEYTILWCEAKDEYRESRGLDITANYNKIMRLGSRVWRVREILRCRGKGDAARVTVFKTTEDYRS